MKQRSNNIPDHKKMAQIYFIKFAIHDIASYLIQMKQVPKLKLFRVLDIHWDIS